MRVMEQVSILTAAGHDLERRLETGELTSVDLVGAFLSQIERHNQKGLKLNAIISACPGEIALARAAQLDDERRNGRVRSKLHGIPIVLKVRSGHLFSLSPVRTCAER